MVDYSLSDVREHACRRSPSRISGEGPLGVAQSDQCGRTPIRSDPEPSSSCLSARTTSPRFTTAKGKILWKGRESVRGNVMRTIIAVAVGKTATADQTFNSSAEIRAANVRPYLSGLQEWLALTGTNRADPPQPVSEP